VGLSALLERTLRGVDLARHRSTPASLFRRADRCRNEGRYDEAARLVASGLRQAPNSSVGHLIAAYLHVARGRTSRAKAEFDRVLALDPHHLRALLGVARIHIEEQNLERAAAVLDRALGYYPEFTEAQALRATFGDLSSAANGRHLPKGDVGSAPGTPSRERDVLVMRTDGHVVLTRTQADRGRQLAQHLMQVYRAASVTLARAGLGPLRGAAIDTGSYLTFLVKDDDLLISATLDGDVEMTAGFAQVARLETVLRPKG